MRKIQQAFNDLLKRGIKYAKVSDYEDVKIITFSAGTTGKYCYVLNGGMEHSSDFKYDKEQEAYSAALKHVMGTPL